MNSRDRHPRPVSGISQHRMLPPDYSFFVALPVGFVTYWLLMRLWILRRYKQSEVTGDDDKYLATSMNRDWLIEMKEES